MTVIINIAQINLQMKNYSSLASNLDLINDLSKLSKGNKANLFHLVKIGDFYYQLFKQYENKQKYLLKAYDYFSRAKRLGAKYQSTTLNAISNYKLSLLYLEENRRKEAEHLIDLSIDGFRKVNSNTYLEKAYAVKAIFKHTDLARD